MITCKLLLCIIKHITSNAVSPGPKVRPRDTLKIITADKNEWQSHLLTITVVLSAFIGSLRSKLVRSFGPSSCNTTFIGSHNCHMTKGTYYNIIHNMHTSYTKIIYRHINLLYLTESRVFYMKLNCDFWHSSRENYEIRMIRIRQQKPIINYIHSPQCCCSPHNCNSSPF